ncbi:oligopeptide/dipeptide ABC transporter ATP-binding protein [Halostagnicola sp. A-GB9-2]|uniref:ABC transporter ATP-binding protein n=1 Tax=Halostagnicola sp. A-GB9-2 TaxID=3048066 RepID=UPI0024BF6FEA|nr:oligopeptide/dipeptide ABC transporter ATP-binding protein [Halostagnicola sp. A-GB9-2]MDJ1434277.1 ATP-binding cassette domain-containing protein [Halostagnicola sp. A-GB9-2]
MSSTLLEVENLSKHFESGGGFLRGSTKTHAVNDVSLDVQEGEVVGVVGESGCGKSTLGKSILRLHEPSSGRVTFDSKDITNLDPKGLRDVRKDMQMIFQDSALSLNPRLKVSRIIDEPLREHSTMSREERRHKVSELLEEIGLKPEHSERYPHEFSGGQRQRIGIARALTLNPRLLIADEPMSGVDVSVQAQLIKLFNELQDEYNLTYLIITHDMNVVRYMTDRVVVMYLGEIVERGPTEEVFRDPKHPYTKALLSAIPTPGKESGDRILLDGAVPDPEDPPQGCSFHTRCPEKIGDICEQQDPAQFDVNGQHAKCHLYDEP